MDLERFLTTPTDKPHGKTDQKETENPVAHSFQLYDKRGEFLGTAEMECEGKIVKLTIDGEKVQGRPLKSLRLKRETGDKKTSFDLLEKLNARGTQFIIDFPNSSGHEYLCERNGNKIFVPPPETPEQIATMLHELGHANQVHDPKFDAIYQLPDCDKVPASSPNLPADIEKILTTLAQIAPNTTPLIEETRSRKNYSDVIKLKKQLIDNKTAIGKIRQHNSELAKRMEKLEREIEKKKQSGQVIDEGGVWDQLNIKLIRGTERAEKAEAQYKELRLKFHQLIEDDASLKYLLELPRNLMERDATKRAIRWMLQIRQETGINLLSVDEDVQTTETLSGAEKCHTASQSSVAKLLGHYLDTYGAKSLRYINPKTGKIIVPKLKS